MYDLASLLTEFRAWIDGHWDPDASLRSWRDTLVDARWARVSWPERWWGRGLDRDADAAVQRELEQRDIPGIPVGASIRLAAPTLLAHGSDALKERLLRPILTGEHAWCQLFSEPGSGSDLAGLTTRAEPDGTDYVVNGQKLWSTSADHAAYGLLLARTNWDVPKHQGITYFALPMGLQGIDVRPLRQMNGKSSFNEVFLSDVRVPADNVVGLPSGGWQVAQTTLENERRLADHRSPVDHAAVGRARTEAAAESRQYFRTYDWYPQRSGRPDLAIEHASGLGRCGDATVRQEVARLIAMLKVAEWTVKRHREARSSNEPRGARGSVAKLNSSQIARQAARVHTLAGGATGMLTGSEAPLGGIIAEVHVSVPAISIAGGTDEIQRNIVAERLLGLPRDPAYDRTQPFRQVRRN